MKRFLFFVVALVFATGIQAQKIDARLTNLCYRYSGAED